MTRAARYMGDRRFELSGAEESSVGKDDVKIKVAYCGICGTDLHIYHGAMDGRVSPPQIIGHEMSGIIEEVGSAVNGFSAGDRVVVRPLDYCGDCPACKAGCSHICHNLKFMGIDSPGAFQNYWTVHARSLHKIPESVSLEHASMIEPLAVACHDVERSRLTAGETVVVIGGGPIGQLIAMAARAKGAKVVVAEVNPSRLEYTSNAGFETINPVEADAEKLVNEMTGGKGADVVFEVSGSAPAVQMMTKLASVRGRICMVAIHPNPKEVDLFQFFWRELEMIGARVYEAADYDNAIDLIARGKVDLGPFVTSVTPLSAIQEAFEELDNNPSGMKSLIECGG